MSEDKKPPFEQARENIKYFTERADMIYTLTNLKRVLDESEHLPDNEKESIQIIVETTLKTLSEYLASKGEEWN